jgi:hypothetical protein
MPQTAEVRSSMRDDLTDEFLTGIYYAKSPRESISKATVFLKSGRAVRLFATEERRAWRD